MSGQNEELANPISIEDLAPKMKMLGKVSEIKLAGAYVDIGVGVPGRLHISRLGEEPVRNVSDVLSEGDEVVVWVQRVNPKKRIIDLTRLQPLAVDWNDIQAGQVYSGKVIRIENFGAFVDLGAERPGLVHVSELSSDYVGNTEDVVTVGQEVQVKVLKVDRRKRQIDLSMKAVEMEEIAEQAAGGVEEEMLPTAMALALKRAMEGGEDEETAPQERQSGRDKSQRQRRELDDIISRTLQQHQRDK
ncbi:MAG: S1 RNA-binding domain-containing protein [Anaerolineae bacterium]|nr:S1 RNA-binding domain-containing protein [Anaerolineae bacterium]